MGLSEHAAIHHQHAIEYANRMGSKDTTLGAVKMAVLFDMGKKKNQ
jgi:hypothetical protein